MDEFKNLDELSESNKTAILAIVSYLLRMSDDQLAIMIVIARQMAMGELAIEPGIQTDVLSCIKRCMDTRGRDANATTPTENLGTTFARNENDAAHGGI